MAAARDHAEQMSAVAYRLTREEAREPGLTIPEPLTRLKQLYPIQAMISATGKKLRTGAARFVPACLGYNSRERRPGRSDRRSKRERIRPADLSRSARGTCGRAARQAP